MTVCNQSVTHTEMGFIKVTIVALLYMRSNTKPEISVR